MDNIEWAVDSEADEITEPKVINHNIKQTPLIVKTTTLCVLQKSINKAIKAQDIKQDEDISMRVLKDEVRGILLSSLWQKGDTLETRFVYQMPYKYTPSNQQEFWLRDK